MIRASLVVIIVCAALILYAYFLYPLLLAAIAAVRDRRPCSEPPAEWPSISITVPAFNEEASIAGTLDRLLALEYPGPRHILVVSDASTDRTDDIVRTYAGRGVELLRMPVRGGKTAAENAASLHLKGDIVVNTDASVRIQRDALPVLIAAFGEPGVGVASGRDVSVARLEETANVGESGYVGYEMWVRRLETRALGIVGASGSFYAIRRDLHRTLLPEALSRDFSAALVAWEAGFRSVSVDGALCAVPRTRLLKTEYRRKVRTVARGIETLWFRRRLLNPLRHGLFSWMLWSHKVLRWASPWLVALGALAASVLATTAPVLWLPVAAGGAALVVAIIGWRWPDDRPMPRLVSLPTYLVVGNWAVIVAGTKALRGELNPIWEPTRRASVERT